MFNSTLRHVALVTVLIASATSFLYADRKADPADTGNAHIFIKDENGTYIPDAPVYFFDGQKMYLAKSSFLGAISVELPAGTYTVSSAMTVPQRDFNERMASPEAHIHILPQDTTSLVLTLHPVDANIDELSAATLKKIGVEDEVARYNN